MLTLAIEVSNPSSGARASEVALGVVSGHGVEVLGVEPIEPGSRERDDLIPACDRLLKRFDKAPGDLGAIAVDIGPGGFTGLRVAVAAAAAMGEALGIGIIAVPATKVAAVWATRQSEPTGEGGAFMVMLATKRHTGYAQVFDAQGHAAGPGDVIGADALEALILPPGTEQGFRLFADAYLPEEFATIASARGWSIEPVGLNAEDLLVAAAAMGNARTPPEALAPLYAREPEAVTLWRARHSEG